MKKLLTLLAVVFTLGLSTVALDAEAAKRLGGGKSVGTQRQAAPPDKSPAVQTPATPAAAGAAAAGSNRSKWLGPVAGLAAGLGIAALASHLGFGEGLANFMTMALIAVAVIALIGFIMRKRAAARGNGGDGLAYAGAGAGTGADAGNQQNNAFRMAAPMANTGASGGSMIGSGLAGNGAAPASRIPADFDVQGFVRNAKVNFIRMQAANDAGNLDDLRQFTTPEMFAELQMDLTERGAATQHTDVPRLDAEVLEVVEEDARYLVSVRFTGQTQERGTTTPEAFDEIWHLAKPRQGSGGWVLAGIQQSTLSS